MNKKSMVLLIRRFLKILAIAMVFYFIIWLEASFHGYISTQWVQWVQWLILLAALVMAGISLIYVNRNKNIVAILAQSEAKFRVLSENSLMGVMMQEYTGKVTYANQSAARIFGFDSPEDLLQADLTHHLVDPMQYRTAFQKLLSSEGILNEEIDIVTTEGESRRVLYSANREKDAIMSTLVDITEREKVEEELSESKQLFHLLIESLPQNIYAKDADGRFVFANQRYCKTQAKQLEEIVGKTDFELHPFEMAEKYRKDDLQVMQTGKALEVEEEHQPLGEEKFFVQVIKTPFYDAKGQTTGTLGIFWDITERKQTEELLRQQSEHIRLLYEASQKLNRTLDLNDIYQAICDFTSNTIPNDSMVISKFDHETKLITCCAFWIDNKWLDASTFPPIPLEEEGRGTQSNVIRTGESMLLNDYQAAVNSARNSYTVDGSTNEISEGTKEHDDVMRSALIVPLKNGDVVNGVIQVMSCNLNAYTENQLKLFEALALHIASAEKNALLYSQVQTELKERKQVEEFLRQLNEEYRLISENTGDTIWIMDIETQSFTYVSPSVEKLLGYSAQEMLGQSLNNLLTEESYNRVMSVIPDRLILFNKNQNATTYTDELEQIRKDSSIVSVEISTTFIVNGMGKLQVTGITRDITERKRAESERQQSEAQFRALFELSPDAVMLIDPHNPVISWPIIDCNEASCLMNGYQRDELIGSSVDIINIRPATPIERTLYLKQLKDAGNLKIETFHRRKNGDIFPIEVSTTLIKIGDRELLIGIDRDITERKQVEEALRQSNETAQAILNAATESVFLLDINGIVHATNETTAKRLGIKVTDLIGRCMYDFLPPDVIESRKKKIGLVFQEHKQIKFEDFRLGAWIESSVYPIFDADGQVTRVAIYGTDTTQRKQTEEVLAASERRYRALIENIGDGIELVDENGNVVYASPSATRVLGYSHEDLLGPVIEKIHPDDLANVMTNLSGVLTSQEMIGQLYRIQHQDGTWRWIEGNATNLLQDPAIGAVVVNFRDVTERKQAAVLQETVYRIAEAAQDAESLQDLYEEIHLNISNVMYAENLYLALYDENSDLLNFVYTVDENGATEEESFRSQKGLTEHVLHTGKSLLFSAEQPTANLEVIGNPPRVWLGVPLIVHGKTTGVLAVQHYTDANAFTEREQHILEFVSSQVAITINRKKTEDAIRMSDERFRQLAENIQEVFWLFGVKEQSIIYISPAYEIIWGRTCQSLYENPNDYLASILQEDQPIMLAALEKQAKGEHTEAEYRVQRPDGSLRWIWDRGFPIFDETGNLVRNAGLATDITSTKATEEELQALNRDLEKRVKERTAEVQQSEATYRALFENANDAIFLIQMDDTFLRVNERCTELLGYSTEELLGRRSLDFIVPTETDEAYHFMDRLLNGERIPMYERRFIKKNGTQINTEINLSLISLGAGHPKLIQSVVRDITERKKAEEALRDSRDQLSVANAALEKASRLKNEFLASMSHELRTPLTGILGLSEALQMQTFGSLNEKQFKALTNIETSGRHLLDLINDILDLSKIEAGKLDLQFELCSVSDICQASLQLTKGMTHQKKQHVHFNINPAAINIRADSRRLKQMLVNLLSNAVKFTPDGGELGLDVQAHKDQNAVTFSVWDKGIGIKPEELEKLFKPFVQLDSSLARQYSGTGLGLSLVKRMAELHGGSIQVESTPAEGSRFTVIMPWSAEDAEPKKSIAIVRTTKKPMVIASQDSAPLVMIADDSEIILEMITDFLEAQGWRVITTRSGLELLVRVDEDHPDIVLVDIQMPPMDGIETIRRLRAHHNPTIASVPIIAVTALAMSEDREKCMQAGANEYMSKPLVLKQLVEQIKEILKK